MIRRQTFKPIFDLTEVFFSRLRKPWTIGYRPEYNTVASFMMLTDNSKIFVTIAKFCLILGKRIAGAILVHFWD